MIIFYTFAFFILSTYCIRSSKQHPIWNSLTRQV